jgi:hypothetical protein
MTAQRRYLLPSDRLSQPRSRHRSRLVSDRSLPSYQGCYYRAVPGATRIRPDRPASRSAIDPVSRRTTARRGGGLWPIAVALVAGYLTPADASAEAVVLSCSPQFIDAPSAVDWSVTGVGQASDEGDADPDATGSFDVIGHVRAGRGFWFVHAEGSTGESSGRVSGRFPLSNGDAASAVDEDGDGRVQISQFNYTQQNETYAFAAGLLDPTCYLDLSDIANDETQAFLAQPFVNNLAVAFPDYTLGGALHVHRESGLEATLFVSSSNGLGDNDSASYSNLIDVTDSGKGIFAALELIGNDAIGYRLGVWINTRDFDELENPGQTADNYGVYASAESGAGPVSWNVRLGAANPDVSETAGFAAVATTFPLGRLTGGLAVSWLRASGDLDRDSSNAVFAEALMHFDFGERFRLTPLLQWTHNDSFTSRDALLVGLRGTYTRSH